MITTLLAHVLLNTAKKQPFGKRGFMGAALAFEWSGLMLVGLLFLMSGMKADTVLFSGKKPQIVRKVNNGSMEAQLRKGHLTPNDYVLDIVTHTAFQGFSERLLPWDDNSRYYDTPLKNVGSLMPYHSHVDPDVVVGTLNRMIDDVDSGKRIFYDFYTEQQKQSDQAKHTTGLFFYRGKPNAPFAIVCPGGGFSYVGSRHEGFSLAMEISKKGLNAFVIRYRVGGRRSGEQAATEDLAAAIAYIFRNAQTLGVSTKRYSLWGGSAGARMVGNIALNGVASYGEGNLTQPATVVIAYTGQSSFSAHFPPTFITVSANDGIANVSTVDRRVQNLKSAGVVVEYRRY